MEFPLLTSPITDWAQYAATHQALELPGVVSIYPAIDGDELAIDMGGSLSRLSVIGETTVWEKVSA